MSAEAARPRAGVRYDGRAVRAWTGPSWIWALLVGGALFCSLAVPSFGTTTNGWDVLRQAVPLAVVAIGQTIVIVSGGIDISVAPVVSMGNTLAMGLMGGHDGARMALGIGLPVLAGVGVGIVNGTIVAVGRVPAFIVTLGVGSVVQGIVFAYTNYATYGSPSPSFGSLGFDDWGPAPALLVLFLPLLAIALLAQNRTAFGRHLFAVGGDDEVARLAGVHVLRTKIAAYALCGGLAALAGVVLATRTGGGEPLAGTGFDWDSVAAAVMGGTLLAGGRGGLGGTMAGVLVVAVINDAMNLQNISTFWQGIVKGGIILIAVVVAAVATGSPLTVAARSLLSRRIDRPGPGAGPGPETREVPAG
jgi:ribose transport system permease protein